MHSGKALALAGNDKRGGSPDGGGFQGSARRQIMAPDNFEGFRGTTMGVRHGATDAMLAFLVIVSPSNGATVWVGRLFFCGYRCEVFGHHFEMLFNSICS